MKITITLQNCERLPGRPFALRGISGKIYGHAQLDRSAGGHTIALDYEELKKIGEDIALASHLPLSKWKIAKIKVEGDEHNEALLSEALEKATAELAAQKGDYEKKIAELQKQLNAAIRAIGAPPAEYIESPTASQVAATLTSEQPAHYAEAPAQHAEPPAEIETGKDEAGSTAQGHSRESLMAIKKFRDLRKICVEAGVPNAEAISDRKEIVDAYFAHLGAANL